MSEKTPSGFTASPYLLLPVRSKPAVIEDWKARYWLTDAEARALRHEGHEVVYTAENGWHVSGERL